MKRLLPLRLLRPKPSTSLVDTVPGEEGEPPMGGDVVSDVGLPGETYDYGYGTDQAGTTTGTATLTLEVDILAADAVDRIAAAIAARVVIQAGRHKIDRIILADAPLLASLRLHSGVTAEMARLETLLDTAERSLAVGDESALGPMAVVPAVAAIRQAAEGAAVALRTLAVTSTYSGRAKVARQLVLEAALTKHLCSGGLDVRLPGLGTGGSSSEALTERALRLQRRSRALTNSDDAITLQGTVETLLELVLGSGDSAAISQRLLAADDLVRTLSRNAALLVTELAFSGGSYRTRKWIFNFLVGQDGLSYSGGAGVSFFLLRGSDRRPLDSDTIYFASPHLRFRRDRNPVVAPTNIRE